MLKTAGNKGIDRFAYPGPVTLYRSWKKWAWFFLGSLAFVLIGLPMVSDPGPNRWFGLVSVLFFGLGALEYGFLIVMRRADRITLGPEGFEVVYLFRRWRTKWEDASGFTPLIDSRIPYDVGVRYHDRTKRASWAVTNPTVPMVNNAGVPDTYGLPAERLAELMNRWRAQALAARPGALIPDKIGNGAGQPSVAPLPTPWSAPGPAPDDVATAKVALRTDAGQPIPSQRGDLRGGAAWTHHPDVVAARARRRGWRYTRRQLLWRLVMPAAFYAILISLMVGLHAIGVDPGFALLVIALAGVVFAFWFALRFLRTTPRPPKGLRGWRHG